MDIDTCLKIFEHCLWIHMVPLSGMWIVVIQSKRIELGNWTVILPPVEVHVTCGEADRVGLEGATQRRADVGPLPRLVRPRNRVVDHPLPQYVPPVAAAGPHGVAGVVDRYRP